MIKRVVNICARYRIAFIYHVPKEGVPKSVTTPVTSVIKNHEDPASRGGPDTRPSPKRAAPLYDDVKIKKKDEEAERRT